MQPDIVLNKQDLTYLRWSHIRSSSGTAGTFLKSQSSLSGSKVYYKLSNYDSVKGVTGHECINELIVCRLLTILGVEHVPYQLIHADIEVDGRVCETYLCASEDFKKRGESKIALDDYCRTHAGAGESGYDFCVRNGWQSYVDTMLAVDYLILNRDRHGANLEVLRNGRSRSLRIAPLFDHGLSLLCSCMTEEEVERFDILEDRRCGNFIGSQSCFENLQLIRNKKEVFPNRLEEWHKEVLLQGLEGTLSQSHLDKIWRMLYERYRIYESL